MQVGIGSYSYPWAIGWPGFIPSPPLNALGLLQKAVQFGISRVQIADNLPLHLLSAEEHAEYIQFATQHSISVEVGTRRLQTENLLLYLQIAVQYQSPFVRVVIDDENFQPSVQEITAIISDVLPFFRKASVMLAIENHDRFPASVLEEIILATDKQWVGICLDTANSLGCGEGILEVCKILSPYTINLHVKDFIIRRIKTKMGFTVEGAAAGAGQLPLKQVLNELKKYNRCISATLEVWSPAAASQKETIEREERWVRKSLDYLKEIITPS